jgi:hypothetical protein
LVSKPKFVNKLTSQIKGAKGMKASKEGGGEALCIKMADEFGVLDTRSEVPLKSPLISAELMYKGSKMCRAIIDTGSSINVITEAYQQKIMPNHPVNRQKVGKLLDANGGMQYTIGTIPDVRFMLGGKGTVCHLNIHKDAPYPLLLGRPWQKENMISIMEKPSGTHFIITYKTEFGEVVTEEILAELVDGSLVGASYFTEDGKGKIEMVEGDLEKETEKEGEQKKFGQDKVQEAAISAESMLDPSVTRLRESAEAPSNLNFNIFLRSTLPLLISCSSQIPLGLDSIEIEPSQNSDASRLDSSFTLGTNDFVSCAHSTLLQPPDPTTCYKLNSPATLKESASLQPGDHLDNKHTPPLLANCCMIELAAGSLADDEAHDASNRHAGTHNSPACSALLLDNSNKLLMHPDTPLLWEHKMQQDRDSLCVQLEAAHMGRYF